MMKASASLSAGDWYKSVDVELDSASESDVKFAKTLLSTISEIKEAPKEITLDIDGMTIKKAFEEPVGSVFPDDKK